MSLPTESLLDREFAESISETFYDPDLSIIKSVIYFDGWADYEECGGILIFRGIDETIQCAEYGYCVMAEDNTNYFRPYELTEADAFNEINEMNETIKNGSCSA